MVSQVERQTTSLSVMFLVEFKFGETFLIELIAEPAEFFG